MCQASLGLRYLCFFSNIGENAIKTFPTFNAYEAQAVVATNNYPCSRIHIDNEARLSRRENILPIW